MTKTFIKNFEGTCKRPTTIEDLKRCVQREGESTRKWYNRVADLIKSSENLSVDTVYSHLADNTNFADLRGKLKRTKKDGMSMSELMAITHKYAESDPTKDDSGEDEDGKPSKGGNGKGGSRSTTKRKSDGGSELVAATANGRGFKHSRPSP